jgi:uncharacterized protein YjiK
MDGLGYDLNRGKMLSHLPKELAEISGLAVRGNELYTVTDEKGKVYVLDRENGHILRTIDFGEDGDYEGIAVVGEDIWVVNSEGTLYRISGERTETYPTWLEKGNDAEGLVYDAEHNRLLIACKSDIRGDGRPKENRYVFAFDLERRVLGEEAVLSIPRRNAFSPSGIAVHADGSLYLCSSVGNWLAWVDADGTIRSQRKLSKRRLPRAEGIAFDAGGSLYLSTEAHKGEPARIYRFPTVE